MANTYKIDRHKKRNKIVRDIINQVPYNQIAKNYDVSEASVRRYAKGRLLENAAAVLNQGNYDGHNLLARVEETMTYVQRMYEACDRWLEDPDDPGEYTLDPRSQELEVVFYEPGPNLDKNGRYIQVKRKANLQQLLDQINETSDKAVISWSTKTADPRTLLLNTAQTLNKQLELLGKIAGIVKDEPQVNVNVGVVIPVLIKVIEEETSEHPEIRAKILRGINEAIAG